MMKISNADRVYTDPSITFKLKSTEASVRLPGIELQKRGYELVHEHEIPLTEDEWLHLDNLTNEEYLPYIQPEAGDTHEALSMSVFRIKKPGKEDIFHTELMDLIASPKMLEFYKKLCHNPCLFIDRAQAHFYKEGDFIARHIDKESYESYLFSLLIGISSDYTGGEMVLYENDHENKFKIPSRSILFADSGIPHEVLPVKTGIRKTIALFLMEPYPPNR